MHQQHIVATGNMVYLFKPFHLFEGFFTVAKISTIAHTMYSGSYRGGGDALQTEKIKRLK